MEEDPEMTAEQFEELRINALKQIQPVVDQQKKLEIRIKNEEAPDKFVDLFNEYVNSKKILVALSYLKKQEKEEKNAKIKDPKHNIYISGWFNMITGNDAFVVGKDNTLTKEYINITKDTETYYDFIKNNKTPEIDVYNVWYLGDNYRNKKSEHEHAKIRVNANNTIQYNISHEQYRISIGQYEWKTSTQKTPGFVARMFGWGGKRRRSTKKAHRKRGKQSRRN